MSQPRFPLMVFAAGFGTRMRELTKDRPKPLIPVLGRSLLDRALDYGHRVSASPMVVNTHYLGEKISKHLEGQDIFISHEDDILETGGGLRRALPLLGAGEVMTLNPDVVWRGENPLQVLAQAWDRAKMDALLLVKPREGLAGRKGGADFTLNQGRIARTKGDEGVVYLGAQILKTEGLAAIKEDVFSLNLLWDQMIASGRAYAVIYDGEWCDVGSPEGLLEAETLLGQP